MSENAGGDRQFRVEQAEAYEYLEAAHDMHFASHGSPAKEFIETLYDGVAGEDQDVIAALATMSRINRVLSQGSGALRSLLTQASIEGMRLQAEIDAASQPTLIDLSEII